MFRVKHIPTGLYVRTVRSDRHGRTHLSNIGKPYQRIEDAKDSTKYIAINSPQQAKFPELELDKNGYLVYKPKDWVVEEVEPVVIENHYIE